MNSKMLVGLFCVLAMFLGVASAVCQPTWNVTGDNVIILNGTEKLVVSLQNGSFSFEYPAGSKSFKPSIQRDEGWVTTKKATRKPTARKYTKGLEVKIEYPVADSRTLYLTINSYDSIPGFYINSSLRCAHRSLDYYFWDWQDGFDSYFTLDINRKIVKKQTAPAEWKRFGSTPFAFIEEKGAGGMALITNCTIGQGGGADRTNFINAVPRWQDIDAKNGLDIGFGVSYAKNPEQAASIRIGAEKLKAAILMPQKKKLKNDYGKPASAWLRNAGSYNGFYNPNSFWTDAVIKDQLTMFPFIVGSTPSKDALDRCHKQGVKLLHYVSYLELLDTKRQVEGGREVYSEWLESIDNESRDLSKHQDWICIDENGNSWRSSFGKSFNHPGLMYTCFYQKGLQKAALQQVKMLMDMGYDGVFLDLAHSVMNCYGDKFGVHSHGDTSKTNTQMYDELQKKIYALVKSYGDDRVVIGNAVSGLIDYHWPYFDGQMWESAIQGYAWNELQADGERNLEYRKHGKIVVVYPSFFQFSSDSRKQKAIYCYAYSSLYSFICADWFELYNKDKALGMELYNLHLGRPLTEKPIIENGVATRVFEHGIVALNTTEEVARLHLSIHKFVSRMHEVGADDISVSADHTLLRDLPASTAVIFTYAKG